MSRSLVALDHNSTIIAVVELSPSSWLAGGVLPGIERQPHEKLEPISERLLVVLHLWRDEAVRTDRTITRIALVFEAGRDGFWLARWLAARGVEAHVIHPSSVAVSREHRRAKTDRLDSEGAVAAADPAQRGARSPFMRLRDSQAGFSRRSRSGRCSTGSAERPARRVGSQGIW